ncbi:hypothetical protein WJX72_003601 [[Myrmecia] bisecta]|uniref:Formate/nitrite transporter n=1 Tax=[Myrmecia] bisecta TaxID=41462 RepID=A0AAW1Q1G1_9CHLO
MPPGGAATGGDTPFDSSKNNIVGTPEGFRRVQPVDQQVAPPATTSPLPVVFTGVLPPRTVFEKTVEAGVYKASLPAWKTFLLAILGGCCVSMSAFLAVSVGANCPGLLASNPGLQKMIYGAFGFPFGLLMVVISGAELFTGNTASVAAAFYEGKVRLRQLLQNWGIAWIGNLAGSLLVVALVSYTGLLSTSIAPQNLASYKTSLTFGQVFVRAIMGNWLVCMAIWQATAAQTMGGKFIGIWLPISAFVALGLEHSVANMFLIPMGMALKAPVTARQFFLQNLIPASLGNIVAGAVCIAAMFSLCYGRLGARLTKQPS